MLFLSVVVLAAGEKVEDGEYRPKDGIKVLSRLPPNRGPRWSEPPSLDPTFTAWYSVTRTGLWGVGSAVLLRSH